LPVVNPITNVSIPLRLSSCYLDNQYPNGMSVMLKRIRQTRTQIEAEMAASLLSAAGLHPAEVRQWAHIAFAGADLGFWVEVPADEEDAAREILSKRDTPEQGSTGPSSTSTILKATVVLVLVLIAAGMLVP
jgi:hypothetical protein